MRIEKITYALNKINQKICELINHKERYKHWLKTKMKMWSSCNKQEIDVNVNI